MSFKWLIAQTLAASRRNFRKDSEARGVAKFSNEAVAVFHGRIWSEMPVVYMSFIRRDMQSRVALLERAALLGMAIAFSKGASGQ